MHTEKMLADAILSPITVFLDPSNTFHSLLFAVIYITSPEKILVRKNSKKINSRKKYTSSKDKSEKTESEKKQAWKKRSSKKHKSEKKQVWEETSLKRKEFQKKKKSEEKQAWKKQVRNFSHRIKIFAKINFAPKCNRRRLEIPPDVASNRSRQDGLLPYIQTYIYTNFGFWFWESWNVDYFGPPSPR